MQAFQHLVALTAPLFALVALGYALSAWGRWPQAGADALTRFVFSVAVPVLLFQLMSGFSRLPPVDPWVLVAYFGGCMLVFVVAPHRGADGCSASTAPRSRSSRWGRSSPTTCCWAFRSPS